MSIEYTPGPPTEPGEYVVVHEDWRGDKLKELVKAEYIFFEGETEEDAKLLLMVSSHLTDFGGMDLLDYLGMKMEDVLFHAGPFVFSEKENQK